MSAVMCSQGHVHIARFALSPFALYLFIVPILQVFQIVLCVGQGRVAMFVSGKVFR